MVEPACSHSLTAYTIFLTDQYQEHRSHIEYISHVTWQIILIYSYYLTVFRSALSATRRTCLVGLLSSGKEKGGRLTASFSQQVLGAKKEVKEVATSMWKQALRQILHTFINSSWKIVVMQKREDTRNRRKDDDICRSSYCYKLLLTHFCLEVSPDKITTFDIDMQRSRHV